MIMVDTAPLVALFDPADSDHKCYVRKLRDIAEPLCTTAPVLTEAFHLLGPGSIGSHRLMDFITGQGLTVWFMDESVTRRPRPAKPLLQRIRHSLHSLDTDARIRV